MTTPDPDPEHQAWLASKRLRANAIDLGHDHYALPYTGGDHDVRIGANILHRAPGGLWCLGSVIYDVPEADPYRRTHNGRLRDAWTLVSSEPLHIEPSVRCSCGDHGFIRDGRWVPA